LEICANVEISDIIRSCISTKKSVSYDVCNRTKDGRNIWMHTTITPIFDAENELVKMIAIDSNISTMKEAEFEIMQRNEEISVQRDYLEQLNNELNKKNEEIGLQKEGLQLLNTQLNRQNTEIIAQRDNLEMLNTELAQRNEEIRTINECLETQKHELEITLENLKKTQLQLVQSEKMASLGVLTAGIAHEINNPLTFILGGICSLRMVTENLINMLQHFDNITTENLSETLKIIEKIKHEMSYDFVKTNVKELIDSIQTGAERTAEIVRALRTFSRLDEDVQKKVNINENIEATLLMLHNQYKDRIEIVRKFAQLPPVLCFPGKINQVFINILLNSIQAIEGKGVIEIETTIFQSDILSVLISIKDNGKGMNEMVRKHIFEPFFTTKDVGKGKGLGLSIAYSIIQNHKGTIEVFSDEGKGTEIVVTLPIS